MTALALAERGRTSGKQFLTSLAVGDDIAARLLVASGLDFGQGWDGSPVYSALAAVAIAARARGLSPLQTQDAFGMAVDQIGGTIQNIWDGATDFKLPQGAVARNAILSVELAAQGWTGMGDALLAPFGFYAQYTAGCADPQLLTADLGKRFYAEAYFKPYPACMAAHSSIDCALALRTRHELDPRRIAAVVVRLPEPLLRNFCGKPFEIRRFPQGDANFSFQFLVANALLRGSVLQDHYEEASIRSLAMTGMLSRVTLARLPAGRSGVEIEVRTDDGDSLVETHGALTDRHPFVKPATRAQIIDKFHQQCAYSGRTTQRQAQQIVARIDALENEADMASFVSLVSG
jgi:2-methylcitrate dehydratase